MKHHYLMASMPMLDLHKPPPLTYTRFRTLCGEHLTRDDLSTLDDLVRNDGAASGHAFVRNWREKESLLRNAAATARAERAGRDALPYLRETRTCSVHITRCVAEAASRPTPLEREMELDRVRWNFIEEIAGFDPFGIEAVLAYALKLRIVERWAGMDDGKGREKVQEIVVQSL